MPREISTFPVTKIFRTLAKPTGISLKRPWQLYTTLHLLKPKELKRIHNIVFAMILLKKM